MSMDATHKMLLDEAGRLLKIYQPHSWRELADQLPNVTALEIQHSLAPRGSDTTVIFDLNQIRHVIKCSGLPELADYIKERAVWLFSTGVCA